MITWSRNPHAKTPIPRKPSKSGLIGVWQKDNLYLPAPTLLEMKKTLTQRILIREREVLGWRHEHLFFDKSFFSSLEYHGREIISPIVFQNLFCFCWFSSFNTTGWKTRSREREREREKRERERVWCCRSYIYSVHRWIVLISDYVVPSNLLSIVTERICYPINEVRDIDLVIFLLFCIFSSETMEKWWSCSIVNGFSSWFLLWLS